jgi:hypothetical protein
MAEHIIFALPDLHVWEMKADPEKWPVLLTNGCCENLLGWDHDNYNPWTADTWVEEFESLGLSVGSVVGGPDGKVPYPLDADQQMWIMEDSDAFSDRSGGYWTYATVSLYKRRRWLSPFVEYSTTWDPLTEGETRDQAGILRNHARVSEAARRHLRAIQTAFDQLPFDTMIELCEPSATINDPLGVVQNDNVPHDYVGYRMYLDLDAAMSHFGTFENYRSWMCENLKIYIIEEVPV